MRPSTNGLTRSPPGVAAAAGVENYAPCPVEVARHEMAQARIAGAVMLLRRRRTEVAPETPLTEDEKRALERALH